MIRVPTEREQTGWRKMMQEAFAALVASLCFTSFGRSLEKQRLRASLLRRRLAASLVLSQRQANYPDLIPTGREQVARFTGFMTATTDRDEGRSGRSLLGRFPESGLSVA